MTVTSVDQGKFRSGFHYNVERFNVRSYMTIRLHGDAICFVCLYESVRNFIADEDVKQEDSHVLKRMFSGYVGSTCGMCCGNGNNNLELIYHHLHKGIVGNDNILCVNPVLHRMLLRNRLL